MGPLRGVLPFVLVVSLLAPCVRADERAYLVRDLPGVTTGSSLDSGSNFWLTIGSTTYFTATDGKSWNVWKTDGTTGGTLRVTNLTNITQPLRFLGNVNGRLILNGYAMDVATGAAVRLTFPSPIGSGVVSDGSLYFLTTSGYAAYQLWRTDGTANGTTQITIPQLLWNADSFGILDGRIVFLGRMNDRIGVYVWDGTTATLLATPSDWSFQRTQVVSFGDRLILAFPEKRVLVVTDGTIAGTRELTLSSAFQLVGVLNGKLYYLDTNAALWETNLLTPGLPLPLANNGQFEFARIAGGKIFLFRRGSVLNPRVLFSFDGQALTSLQTINADPFELTESLSFAGNDGLYFSNDDGVHGRELWRSDGTIAGTRMLADLNPGPGHGFYGKGFARPDGLLLAGSNPRTGTEPYFFHDGTALLLANIGNDSPIHGSSPSLLRANGDRVSFVASSNTGSITGVSDGTQAGTTALAHPATTAADVVATRDRNFIVSDKGLVVATDLRSGGSTVLPQAANSTVSAFRNGVAFISGAYATDGRLVISDGTLEGTRTYALPVDAQYVDRRVFVTGDQLWVANGPHLWRFTETALSELPLANRTGNISELVQAGNDIWFIEEWSRNDGAGSRVWRAAGAASSPEVVKTFDPTVQNLEPSSLSANGGSAYFVRGATLYRASGREVFEVSLPASLNDCNRLEAFGTNVVFALATRSGYTLWRSDGTTSGTVLLYQDENSTNVCRRQPAILGNRIFFSGFDSAHGLEPWVSDGTVAGTHMYADVEQGSRGSEPLEFTVAASRVFFSAYTTNYGRELWAIGDVTPPSRQRAVR